jgi:predicted RNA-binding Zn-ribbon protein involved in translation (DUF1610 family)
MIISEEKTTAFWCPKCDQDGLKNEARKTKEGNFLCSHCGSTYKDRLSAWDLFKKQN